MRFTDKAIAAIRPRKQRYEAWEGGGFGVRVSPRGVKSWVFVYHFQGRSRRLTLGTYPALGLADARIRLAAARKLLGEGKDPGALAVERHRTERAAETVAELVDAYLEKYARVRKRSAAADERMLRKDVLPAWGRRKAKDITRRDVIALLDGIVARGAPIAANRALAVVRRMFGWAMSRDLVPASPCIAIEAPGEEHRRDRVLSADEIAAFWRGLDHPELAMSRPVRLALKFQLATAQRKGELVGAEWSELDLDARMWSIPAAKAKNGMAHRVPLSELALELLAELKEATQPAAGSDAQRWLFPAAHSDKHITGGAVDHALRINRPLLGIENIVPHDLRRSAASHMTSMDISRDTVAKVLNHVTRGAIATYDRHSYDSQKRNALNLWGVRLKTIIDGTAPANVVRLRELA
jgi:integrase